MNRNYIIGALLAFAFAMGMWSNPAPAESEDIAEPYSYTMKRMLCAPPDLVIRSFLSQGYEVVGVSIEYEKDQNDATPIKLEVAVLVHPVHRQVMVFETRGEVTCLASTGVRFLFYPEILAKRSTPL